MNGGAWWAALCGVAKSRTRLSDFTLMRWRRKWQPHSCVLAWRIPGTGEPGGLQSMGSRRVGHDWATSLSLFTFMHWRRQWQPTPVFLPGESQGRGSLVGCCLWGHTESDTTEATAAAAAGRLTSNLLCLNLEFITFAFLPSLESIAPLFLQEFFCHFLSHLFWELELLTMSDYLTLFHR